MRSKRLCFACNEDDSKGVETRHNHCLITSEYTLSTTRLREGDLLITSI